MLQIPKRIIKTTRLQDESLKRRSSVLHILFIVTFAILALSALSIIVAYFTGFNRLVLHRLAAVTAAILVVSALYVCLKKRRYFIAASGLLAIYWLLATVMALTWGVALPNALLLYCALIVLSGIVLGATYAIVTLVTSSVMIFIIQLATVQGRLHPNFYWETQPPHLSDLTTFYFVFAIVGVSSWLFNRQTDRSLHRALRAESALQREKATLETKVIARTQELEKAQAEKIRQLHRFAELGQFSTSLLHDLSNHITTLSVDIEGMGEQNKNYHSQLQLRIQRRIAYIDAMVQWAHDHINGKVQTRLFDATHEVQAVVKLLQYNARNAHVQLHGMPKDTPKLMLHGDPNRFQQLITNLISNAIDAYHDAPSTKHDVFITGAQNDDDSITITVHDTGAGIPEDIQKHIFDAFYTTKQNGMGIGLFIVKQIVEEYFDGTIELSSQKGETIFTVRLRKMHENTSSPDGN